MVYARDETLSVDRWRSSEASTSAAVRVSQIESCARNVTDSQRGQPEHDGLGNPTSPEARGGVNTVRQGGLAVAALPAPRPRGE